MSKVFVFYADGVASEPWGFADALNASNQEANRAHYIRRNMGFDKLFFPCDLACVKPEAAFYQEIARHFDSKVEPFRF